MLYIYECLVKLGNISISDLETIQLCAPLDSSFYYVVTQYSKLYIGLVFEKPRTDNIILVNAQIRNKTKLYIFKKVINYDILTSGKLTPDVSLYNLDINEIDQMMRNVSIGYKEQKLGLEQRYWMENVMYYGDV